jgi:hypothetical protein
MAKDEVRQPHFRSYWTTSFRLTICVALSTRLSAHSARRNLDSAYNLKRITNVLGATKLTEALHQG